MEGGESRSAPLAPSVVKSSGGGPDCVWLTVAVEMGGMSRGIMFCEDDLDMASRPSPGWTLVIA